MNKTKVILSESQKWVQNAGKWTCGVCDRGVCKSLTQCTNCWKWVHKKRRCRNGSMLYQPASTARTIVDTSDGDLLSIDVGDNAAVKLRVWKERNKFRQLVRGLSNKDVSFLMRGKLYGSCMQLVGRGVISHASLNSISRLFCWIFNTCICTLSLGGNGKNIFGLKCLVSLADSGRRPPVFLLEIFKKIT